MIGGSSQSRVGRYRDQSVRDERKRECGDLPLIVATVLFKYYVMW
jgi:hypothetical protein